LARRGNGALKATSSECGAQMLEKGRKMNIINLKILLFGFYSPDIVEGNRKINK
jgi:hypothetical protein